MLPLSGFIYYFLNTLLIQIDKIIFKAKKTMQLVLELV